MQDDFGGKFGGQEGGGNQKAKTNKQNGETQSDISDMKDTVRNSLLRAVDIIYGRAGGKNDLWNLGEIGNQFRLEGDFWKFTKSVR